MRTVEEIRNKSAQLREFFDQYLPYSRPNPILADFVKIQHELMWGGIWLMEGLDLRLRCVATITAQCINAYDFGVEHQVRTGLTVGLTAQEIKGIFIQLLFLVGEPVALFGLRIAQDVINERESWRNTDRALPADRDQVTHEKIEISKLTRLERSGAGNSDQIADTVTHKLMPDLSRLVDGYYFGDVWRRDDLKPKDRMVCSLAALMCRAHHGQLKNQIGLALDMGMNKREICEVFSQAGWYRGWPYVEDALNHAQDLFEERNL